MGLLSRLFGKKADEMPELDREQSMQAVPVLNQMISVEYNADENVVLNIPRKRTSMMRIIGKFFNIPPYKQIELDELGTYVVELCDGEHTVEQIVEEFAGHFKLNHREAEVSMVAYMKKLGKRGIIGFAVPKEDEDENS
ncbi:MAG: PqqD family protein [Planctomycetes bacterium]|nr:PqqD family protein [Planctomycetota bacterium]